jgi:hypothetical protein
MPDKMELIALSWPNEDWRIAAMADDAGKNILLVCKSPNPTISPPMASFLVLPAFIFLSFANILYLF